MKTELRDTLTPDQREKWDVLEKGETRREKLWADCVAEAKRLIKKYDDIRMDIAELAMRACADAEIKGVKFKYTVSRFAMEIGLAESTLRAWVEARRVLIRLPVEKRTYNLEFYKEAARIVLPTDRPEQVERKFNRVVRQKQSRNAKWVKYERLLKSVLSTSKNAERVQEADSDTLESIMHLCTEINHYIDLNKNSRKKTAG
jgi:hypothetical protein